MVNHNLETICVLERRLSLAVDKHKSSALLTLPSPVNDLKYLFPRTFSENIDTGETKITSSDKPANSRGVKFV